MRKAVILFNLAAILFISVALWILIANFDGGFQDILSVSGVTIMLGFTIYFVISKIRSANRKEPCEDELSKTIMTKASSLSFYISVFFWLFLLFVGDKTTMQTHNLIGTGIMGMSLIFLFSWAGVKFFGLKNG
jgi:hypothetical protein